MRGCSSRRIGKAHIVAAQFQQALGFMGHGRAEGARLRVGMDDVNFIHEGSSAR
jgi:hypothetical protein